MAEPIIVRSKQLTVRFDITEEGIVELTGFTPEGITSTAKDRTDEKREPFPIIEMNITGRAARESHGFKHSVSGSSLDLRYVSHEITEKADSKELVITLKTDYDVYARYHMSIYEAAPVVRVVTEIENRGSEELPVEYLSSFVCHDLCGRGEKYYFDKTDIYTPHNSWACEAQWEKADAAEINLSAMPVNGFSLPTAGLNRYAYMSHSSWSSVEYLPMGICHDRETDETWIFEVESSGQWLIEYDSVIGRRLGLCLSGPTESEHGWWLDLKPGVKFTTVPAAFGMVSGGVNEAMAAMTLYRRAMRRPNADDEKLNVVFNDYMNCLFGDPTEEKEKAIIDIAADMGCEYYCMDCGWYDKGDWWPTIGKWEESGERFPNGMKTVCDYAKSKGLVMGLWLEIEAMGVECDFAKTLPDSWFVCRHGKRHVYNKRYLLDFRNPEVYTYCMNVVERLIRDYGVGYFKIDYNVIHGAGSDIDSESGSGSILGHYDALHRWYEELFAKHPDLVIENCGSGAQRMDYGMLRLLSLQSTSDQTDYIHNSYIASNVATAVTPEQAGMWVYPYEDEEEHVIYNMVNGLLLRPYMSGMVWKFGENTMDLLREGIGLYKKIRGDIRNSVPFWPTGLNSVHDAVLTYGVQNEKKAYLSVFTPKTDTAEIPLSFDGRTVDQVRVIYPAKENCKYTYKDGRLRVKMPQNAAARLFEITFR